MDHFSLYPTSSNQTLRQMELLGEAERIHTLKEAKAARRQLQQEAAELKAKNKLVGKSEALTRWPWQDYRPTQN